MLSTRSKRRTKLELGRTRILSDELLLYDVRRDLWPIGDYIMMECVDIYVEFRVSDSRKDMCVFS